MQTQRNRDLLAFVTAHLPAPPASVLEVGCGRGELARALVETGREVTGIDPEAPDGPPFVRVTLEHFETPDRFDAVVAASSLHHLHDLPAALDKISGLLVPGGVLIRDASKAVIGAVGISGDTSDKDEACALAGIQAAGLTGDTG